MNVTINGTDHELSDGARVEDAIAASGAQLDASRRGVAVAVDGEVVPRAEWGTRELGEGARVEVLTAMQGG